MSGSSYFSRTRRLQDKRIIITGASGFIGQELVSICLTEGAKVVAFDKKEFEPTWSVTEHIHSGRLVLLLGDITSQDDCVAMVEAARVAFGGMDALINAVGILHPGDGRPGETTEDVWDQTMAVNVKGPWLSCRACIPCLMQQDGGSIVNVASLVGLRGSYVPQVAYTASKGALIALTRELAVHLAPHKIRVNCVCPGPLQGGLIAEKLTSNTSKQIRTKSIPLGRLGQAREVALACVYLASDDSSFTTGIELIVDGGASASFIRP
jgi:NAD(P)-dependent dehydrogenase (short-subunit alcohol dehydrogenase family)